MSIVVELKSRDRIEIDWAANAERPRMRVFGCSELLELVTRYKAKFGLDLRKWRDPQGNSHSEILLREALMRLRSEWQFPYEHSELCHCRAVSTESVDQSIVGGAHRVEEVQCRTGAGTACGVCQSEIEKIIHYRLR